MSSDTFKGQEKARFPALLGVALLFAIVVIAIAFAVDSEIGIPVLILAVICVIAAVGFRVLTGSNRDSGDASDNVAKVQPDTERPLGDTPDAHDEISPHDLPLSNPGRKEAEKMAGGGETSTTRGHDEGGAAGRGGPGDVDTVGADEKDGAKP